MSFPEIDPSFLLPDEVWERVSHVIPADRPKPKGGRPRMDNRQALNAIFYVLRTGLSMECNSEEFRRIDTVHDRFSEWAEAGVFERLWEEGLNQYADEVGIEWEWHAMDGALVKAPLGGKSNGA